MVMGNFERRKGQPIVNYRDQYAVWVMDSGGAKEALHRTQIPPCKGEIIRGKDFPSTPDDSDTAVICAIMAEPIDLLFGLWAEEKTSSIVFTRWRHEGTLAQPGKYN